MAIDGEITGTWRRSGIDVALTGWHPLTARHREAEAARLPIREDHASVRVPLVRVLTEIPARPRARPRGGRAPKTPSGHEPCRTERAPQKATMNASDPSHNDTWRRVRRGTSRRVWCGSDPALWGTLDPGATLSHPRLRYGQG